MSKATKKVVLPLILFMVLLLSAVSVQADFTGKVVSVKYGKWKTVGPLGRHFLKVKIPKNGEVTIYTKGQSMVPYVTFHKKKPTSAVISTYGTKTNRKFKKNKVYKDTICLKKGTYYFMTYCYNQMVSLKYKATKSIRIRNNLSQNTAAALPEKTKVKEWYSKDKRGSRWYKISLSQPSKIWLKMDMLDYYLYDETGKELDLYSEDLENPWQWTPNEMQPGTYYIKSEPYDKGEFVPEWSGGIEPYMLFDSTVQWSATAP